MRKRVLAILSGLAIVASTLALVPDEAAADLGVVADSGAAGSAVEDLEAGCRVAAFGAGCPAVVLEVGLPVAVSGAAHPRAGSGVPVSVAVAPWQWPVSAAVRS
jgi:hypothetical protein